MDTFGETLRNSREKKGYSFEQVARDTNIAKKFLIALEEEDFSIFPGEPYLIGFLKNYSDYLGLDSVKIIALHRNMKLQEQPAPIEELLSSEKSKFPVVLIIILIIALVSAGGYYLYNYIISKVEQVLPVEIVETDEEPVNLYSFDISKDGIEDRFPEGSELEIVIFEDVYTIHLKSITSNVILSLPGGERVYNLGDEKKSDINGDGLPDISIVVNDIDISKKTAVIGISAVERVVVSPITSELLDQGESKVASRNQNITVILDEKNPVPFVLDVVFRGNTLLRYQVDRDERVERYFDKDETLRLDINREVMIWVANAGSLKAKISGVEVSLGRSGEVATQLIKWNKNSESGKYDLQMIPVY
jgi:cytoskeleton protein RodZ